MIQPSVMTLAQYWNALKNDRPTEIQMIFTGQGVTLDSSDIDASGITISDILNGESKLSFGKAVSKQFTANILLSDKTNGLDWTGEFQLKLGVKGIGSNTFEYVTVGYFHGERPRNVTTVNTISFTAYDRMTKFDISANGFLNTVADMITVEDYYHILCNYVGIGYEAVGSERIWDNVLTVLPEFREGTTCREILARIAEASGTYARINSSGNCELIWFDDTYENSYAVTGDEEFYIDHSDIYSSITWNQFDALTLSEAESKTYNEMSGDCSTEYRVSAVKFITENRGFVYPRWFGQTSNVYTITDNPFLYVKDNPKHDADEDVADDLLRKLQAFGGKLPMSVECIGNWCVESGDIISVSAGENVIKMPIYCRTLRWNGAVEDVYETTGELWT